MESPTYLISVEELMFLTSISLKDICTSTTQSVVSEHLYTSYMHAKHLNKHPNYILELSSGIANIVKKNAYVLNNASAYGVVSNPLQAEARYTNHYEYNYQYSSLLFVYAVFIWATRKKLKVFTKGILHVVEQHGTEVSEHGLWTSVPRVER